MKLCVVGAGYAGLVVATGLAENGHEVVCVDTDGEKIAALEAGRMYHYEPGLSELVSRNVQEGRLAFTADTGEAVEKSLIVFLSVGTPADEQGVADTSQLTAAAEAVGRSIKEYRIVALKSAAPPGTAERVKAAVGKHATGSFAVVVNPDFFKEGAAVEDFMKPDRIVIGSEDVRVIEIMRELYAPFLRTGKPLLTMGVRSAELTQYAVNAMLASRITMMNQLAAICEATGADIDEVRDALAADVRIGPSYLFPGIGFGGPGIPKDVAAAIHLARESALGGEFLESIVLANRKQQQTFIQRVIDYYDDGIRGKRISCWGVTFKPRTDDLRGSQALFFIDTLLEHGAEVVAFDPVAGPKLRAVYKDRISVANRSYDALADSDGLIISTEWREFHRPNYQTMAEKMRRKVVFDGRNLYTPQVMKDAGFQYFSVGRPPV